MRIVVQRCTRAEVRIAGTVVGKIGQGFMLLVGITDTDTTADADLLAKKIAQLRVFEDPDGKMNLASSGNEVKGKTEFKDAVQGTELTMNKVEAKQSFKSMNIKDGM